MGLTLSGCWCISRARTVDNIAGVSTWIWVMTFQSYNLCSGEERSFVLTFSHVKVKK